MKTNANFRYEPKNQASSWVPHKGCQSFMNCALSVHKCMKQKMSEKFNIAIPKLQLSAFFINPSSRKTSMLYCWCSNTALERSAGILAPLFLEVKAHFCVTTGILLFLTAMSTQISNFLFNDHLREDPLEETASDFSFC